MKNVTFFRGKNVVVVGLGKSGIAASRLLLKAGANVFGIDAKSRNELSTELEILERDGVVIHCETQLNDSLEIDMIVISPGVRIDSEFVVAKEKRGIPIIGEIELAYMFLEGTLVAVTGTNGKTTTASLIACMLREEGKNVLVGGNIAPGVPLSTVALDAKVDDVIVAEVSTFQLETVSKFHPYVGVLTNISPDHMDRHHNFETYLSLKGRLFACQEEDDWAVVNGDEPNSMRATSKIRSKRVTFSIRGDCILGTWMHEREIYGRLGSEKIHIASASDLRLRGKHNLENALAAACVSLILGGKPENIRHAMQKFRGVPHRLEEVAKIDGVLFVNNSMCTNPESAVSSIEAFDEQLILISGGKEKGTDMCHFYEAIVRKVKFAILIGESAHRIYEELKRIGYERTVIAYSIDEAVMLAKEKASAGEVVLLSPGFASFDMFKDFIDRGEKFKEAVKKISL